MRPHARARSQSIGEPRRAGRVRASCSQLVGCGGFGLFFFHATVFFRALVNLPRPVHSTGSPRQPALACLVGLKLPTPRKSPPSPPPTLSEHQRRAPACTVHAATGITSATTPAVTPVTSGGMQWYRAVPPPSPLPPLWSNHRHVQSPPAPPTGRAGRHSRKPDTRRRRLRVGNLRPPATPTARASALRKAAAPNPSPTAPAGGAAGCLARGTVPRRRRAPILERHSPRGPPHEGPLHRRRTAISTCPDANGVAAEGTPLTATRVAHCAARAAAVAAVCAAARSTNHVDNGGGGGDIGSSAPRDAARGPPRGEHLRSRGSRAAIVSLHLFLRRCGPHAGGRGEVRRPVGNSPLDGVGGGGGGQCLGDREYEAAAQCGEQAVHGAPPC